ncbi:hypothetical protein R3P38DRAFT_3383018 [Favolaschia claudopus]|uniref:CBS-domain-containing protein n=1 Tax=Favolaschia claudopus TaxID=2862362 RepID=A0AAW0EK37_9AGAR
MCPKILKHYLWASGHFLLLLASARYFLSWIMFKSVSAWWYKASFTGALVSYAIVCQKSLGTPQPNAAFIMRAMLDENVQYFLLAFFWWTSKPIAITLVPYTIFSLFHALTFTRTTLMPQFLPPGPPASAGGPPTPHPIAKRLQTWVKSNYDGAMKVVAYTELVIFVRVLVGAITFQNSLLSPIIYVHFVRQRYYQSAFTREAIGGATNYIDTFVRKPGNPPMLVQVWDRIQMLVGRWVGTTLAPNPAALRELHLTEHIMATSIASALTDFLNALTGVFFSLLNSVLAFFQAIAVLGKDIIASAINLVQSFVALGLGLLQGVYGFIAVPFPPEQRESPAHRAGASMSTLSSQAFPSSMSESRKKETRKKDEALRQKIQSELSRKRTISTTSGMQGGKRGSRVHAAKGTVAALRPSPALTVPESITVSEASQLCAAKRTDCVLVVDEEEGLSGIFTAKDMAYRVTADGLNPHTTPVHQIMTRNPMVTRDTTSATEALQLMVSKHFRHLPVCNEEGNVVGLLDITKVFHEALSKVERSSVASEQLFAAMAGVQSELGSAGSNPQAIAMLAWAEKLREKTALPDLTTVMDVRSHPATVGPKTTVREAARLMKERRVTAVCVMDAVTPATPGMGPSEKIAGIFTSKDVVLRVIAAGLDAGRCSVVRVMTPHPDTAPPTMTIHDALKKMHNGHYLNLPVVEEDGHLSAIIDVLTLTYATLEQMNAMTAGDNSNTNEGEGGPMWGRFFDSIGHDDNDSYLSGSRATPEIQSLASMHNLRPPQSPQSEVHPNDSASVMDDEPSGLGYGQRHAPGSITGVVPVDDGTYVFKFKTPSGRTHRFQARHDSVEHLREIVAGKLATDPFFTEFKSTSDPAVIPDPIDFHLSYKDADGDLVFVTSDHDVIDAVKTARTSGADRVVLEVQGGKGWGQGETEKKPEPIVVPEVVSPPVTEAENVKSVLLEGNTIPRQQIPDEIMGIPKDILLPASIVTLAVAIIGVFAASRFSSRY